MFAVWSVHKRAWYVKLIFHFSFGILPFFIGADRSLFSFFREQQRGKLEAQCETQFFNANSPEHLRLWFLKPAWSQKKLLIDSKSFCRFILFCYRMSLSIPLFSHNRLCQENTSVPLLYLLPRKNIVLPLVRLIQRGSLTTKMNSFF